MSNDFSDEELKILHSTLLPWFDRNRRLLPWRGDSSPFTSSSSSSSSPGPTTYKNAYGTWVSEVMCQQTRVDTVIPFFINWMEKWPTPIHLAEASEDVVQSAWAGLGFYRRARNLHLGAKKVVEKYNGIVPSTVTGLLDINGIGEYTAGAIASIAFGIRTPLVDGNVIRVISRLKALGGLSKNCVASGAAIKDAKSPELSKSVWSIVRRQGFINEERPGDFNQALMEFGATLCTPRNPLCFKCPLGGGASKGKIICKAYLEAKEETKTIATTTTTTTALVEIEDLTTLDDDNDHIDIQQTSTNTLSTSSSLLPKIKKSNKVENKISSSQVKNSKAVGKALIQTKLSFGSSRDGSGGGSTLSLVSSSGIKGEGEEEKEKKVSSIISSAISTYISDRFPPIHSKTPSPIQKVVAVVFETRFTDDDIGGGGGGGGGGEKKARFIDDKKFLVIKREGGAAGGAASGLLVGQWQTFCFCNGAAISTTPPSITATATVSTLKEKVIKKRKRKNETVIEDKDEDEDKDDEKDDMKEKMSSTSSILKSNTSSTIPLTLGDIRALSPHLDKTLKLFTSDQVIIRGPKKTRHIFSHVVHDITVFTILVSSSVDKSQLVNQLGVSDHKWVSASEMQDLGLSTWALKILDASGSFTDLKGAEWMKPRLKG